jgi:hypothetical protein
LDHSNKAEEEGKKITCWISLFVNVTIPGKHGIHESGNERYKAGNTNLVIQKTSKTDCSEPVWRSTVQFLYDQVNLAYQEVTHVILSIYE